MNLWTKAEETKLLRAVAGAPSVSAAVDAARAALPSRGLTLDAVANKLRRMGQPNLSELVARTAPTTEGQLSTLRLTKKTSSLEAANRRLLEDLAAKGDELDAMRSLQAAKPLPAIEVPKRVGALQRRGVPVMLCSDWHVEEPVDPKKVNGLNEYSPAVAEKCIDKMADAFEWMMRDARYDCREAVIWLGGDLYSGYIHDELVEGNEMSPVEAVIWLQERIEKMLRKIAATCPSLGRIIVPCNDGNHGRLTEKIRVGTRAKNSLEWLLYQNLAVRLRDDDRFQFQIADGEWTFLDVYDRTLGFTHGDSFRYQGGVGGLLIPVRRGLNEMRKYRKISVANMGHFHQRLDLNDIVVNGSMIGINPYSMRIHASPEPRQQAWYMVDSSRGKCLSAPIWFD